MQQNITKHLHPYTVQYIMDTIGDPGMLQWQSKEMALINHVHMHLWPEACTVVTKWSQVTPPNYPASLDVLKN